MKNIPLALPTLYMGRYNFRTDTNGIVPTDWNETGNNVEVRDYYNDHKKVIEMTTGTARMDLDLGAVYAIGTMECYMLFPADPGPSLPGIGLFPAVGAPGPDPFIGAFNGNIVAYVAGIPNNLEALVTEHWYHFKIKFNCTLNQHLYYVDGTEYGPFGGGVPVATVSAIAAGTNGTNVVYADSIDFSYWPGYVEGRCTTPFYNIVNKYMVKPIIWAHPNSV